VCKMLRKCVKCWESIRIYKYVEKVCESAQSVEKVWESAQSVEKVCKSAQNVEKVHTMFRKSEKECCKLEKRCAVSFTVRANFFY